MKLDSYVIKYIVIYVVICMYMGALNVNYIILQLLNRVIPLL